MNSWAFACKWIFREIGLPPLDTALRSLAVQFWTSGRWLRCGRRVVFQRPAGNGKSATPHCRFPPRSRGVGPLLRVCLSEYEVTGFISGSLSAARAPVGKVRRALFSQPFEVRSTSSRKGVSRAWCTRKGVTTSVHNEWMKFFFCEQLIWKY